MAFHQWTRWNQPPTSRNLNSITVNTWNLTELEINIYPPIIQRRDLTTALNQIMRIPPWEWRWLKYDEVSDSPSALNGVEFLFRIYMEVSAKQIAVIITWVWVRMNQNARERDGLAWEAMLQVLLEQASKSFSELSIQPYFGMHAPCVYINHIIIYCLHMLCS